MYRIVESGINTILYVNYTGIKIKKNNPEQIVHLRIVVEVEI